MNHRTHFTFGTAFAALVYLMTTSVPLAILSLFVQVGLVLDFVLNKLFGKEPFHSLTFMFIVSGVAYFINPSIALIVFLSYASHLFLDLFAEEKLEWFFPFSKKSFSLYKKDHEAMVANVSMFTTIILLAIIYLKHF